MWRTVPSSTSSCNAARVSSIGVPSSGSCIWKTSITSVRSRHQRLRRPRQRNVELAEPGAASFLDEQRRLDDDDVIELETLRLPWRQHGDRHLVECLYGRRARE